MIDASLTLRQSQPQVPVLRAPTGEPEVARCLGSSSPATPSNQSKKSMKYAIYSSPKTHLRVPHKSEKLHGCGGENFCRPLEIWVLLKCLFHLQVGWKSPGIDFLEGSRRYGWVFFNEPTLTKCPCHDSWTGTVWGWVPTDGTHCPSQGWHMAHSRDFQRKGENRGTSLPRAPLTLSWSFLEGRGC